MSRRPRYELSPAGRFAAWTLVAAGALIAALCGGCGMVFAVGYLANGGASDPAVLIVPGLMGGLPAAGGVFLLRAGWRRLHPAK